jgi:hypothetical protein
MLRIAPASSGCLSSSIQLDCSSRTIFTLMIALFLPTGNHDIEKTVTLTNRYTNTYFRTY